MRLKSFQDLNVFVRTADLGSLSAAARSLDISPAVASAALKRLEQELGVALFVRTTRSLRLSQSGEAFLGRCREALDSIEAGCEEIALGDATVQGKLHLSLPSDLGRNVMMAWLDEFMALHPRLSLKLQISDRLADVYRTPIDAAVRYGKLPDSGLIALPLVKDCGRVLCAAPSYLARNPAPVSPWDLVRHDCLCFLLSDYVHDCWRFSRSGSTCEVHVKPRRVADDGDVVRRWALAGLGIAYKSRLDVAEDLASGRLVALCQDWEGEPAPLYLACPDRHQFSPTIRALYTFLGERLRHWDRETAQLSGGTVAG